MGKLIRLGFLLFLGKHQLEFISGGDDQCCPGFWTYAKPVDPARWFYRAIGLYRYFYIFFMESIDQSFIQLQQGFSARANHQRFTGPANRPKRQYLLHQSRCFVLPPVISVNTYEVRITKPANSLVAVGFPPTPQVASRKAAKNGRPAGLCAFPLQTIE